MKKLLFATALVASAAAFADPTALNAISFEGYSADATFANGQPEKDESGNDKTGNPSYFYYDGDADGSSVKTFATGDAGSASCTRPFFFQGVSPALNYLELSTEGGTLWRSINPISSTTVGEDTTYDLGTAQAVAADGIYLDTLVQFTPTEDGGAPELDGADKLAIWLNVDGNSVTNLMVRAGFVDDNGTDTTQTPTTYTLTTASPVVPGQWYRLTVKTIADVTQQVAKNPLAYEAGYTGFEIYLDGVLLAATAPAFGEGFIDLATDAGEFGWLDQTDDASLITYLQSGTVFPALGLPTTTYTLQSVGFKGSGALDDIVWTEENPFQAPAALEFTLTWDPTKVSTVSYVLSTDLATTNALTSGTAVQIAAGTTGMVELIPTFEAGYEFDYLQIGTNEWPSLTFPVPDVSTNGTLVARASAPAYPTYLETADQTIKGKYDTWKATYGADVNSAYEAAFLLNADPLNLPVGAAYLKIASITEVATGWELEIVSDATTLTAESNNSGLVGNGYLAIKYASTLAGLTSGGTLVNLPVTVTNGKITVTVTAEGAKFMKATLSTTPVVQQ